MSSSSGKVITICIAPQAGAPMQTVMEVEAIAGAGLRGDRYAAGEGSYNRGAIGKRQVTLINALFFPDSGFTFQESRRNIATIGVELMWLIGREFQIGAARMRGLKYCDPCKRPSKLSGKRTNFDDQFHDRGGLVAEILEGGLIKFEDAITPPPRSY